MKINIVMCVLNCDLYIVSISNPTQHGVKSLRIEHQRGWKSRLFYVWRRCKLL